MTSVVVSENAWYDHDEACFSAETNGSTGETQAGSWKSRTLDSELEQDGSTKSKVKTAEKGIYCNCVGRED